MMDNFSSLFLVTFVAILFLVFSILQVKTGLKKSQQADGSRSHHILRIVFALPLLAISLIALVLILINLIP